MNPFVNFQKRTIQLPPGCKDLMDVLRTLHREGPRKADTCKERLSDVGHYLNRLLEPPGGESRQVVIFCYECRAVVCLDFGPFLIGCRPSGLSALVFVDGAEPLQEQAVRTVFEQANIPPFLESGVPGMDGPTRLLRYALPSTVADATRLITALFRQGFGVSKKTRMGFHYLDRNAP
jgi:hypothetical protein